MGPSIPAKSPCRGGDRQVTGGASREHRQLIRQPQHRGLWHRPEGIRCELARSWANTTFVWSSRSQLAPGSSRPAARVKLAGPGRVAQDRLQEMGVDEHQGRLEKVEREYIRDRTLEGHESARTRGKAIGGAMSCGVAGARLPVNVSHFAVAGLARCR